MSGGGSNLDRGGDDGSDVASVPDTWCGRALKWPFARRGKEWWANAMAWKPHHGYDKQEEDNDFPGPGLQLAEPVPWPGPIPRSELTEIKVTERGCDVFIEVGDSNADIVPIVNKYRDRASSLRCLCRTPGHMMKLRGTLPSMGTGDKSLKLLLAVDTGDEIKTNQELHKNIIDTMKTWYSDRERFSNDRTLVVFLEDDTKEYLDEIDDTQSHLSSAFVLTRSGMDSVTNMADLYKRYMAGLHPQHSPHADLVRPLDRDTTDRVVTAHAKFTNALFANTDVGRLPFIHEFIAYETECSELTASGVTHCIDLNSDGSGSEPGTPPEQKVLQPIDFTRAGEELPPIVVPPVSL